MTVQTSVRSAGPFVCTGGETVFSYAFQVLSAADLAVYRMRGGAPEQLVIGIDYAVDGVGAEAGGYVVLNVAALDGDEYVLVGERPHERGTDLQYARALPPLALNREFDSLQIQIVELGRDMSRAVRRSRFDIGEGVTLELPPIEPNKFLGTDDNGNIVFKSGADGTGSGSIPDPLPVTMGGTGGDTAQEARVNIGAITTSDVPGILGSDFAANGATRRAQLGLGDLAELDAVGADQVEPGAIGLVHLQTGIPGYVIGYNDATGVPEARATVDSVRVTALGRHSMGGGGATRQWIVAQSELFAAGDGATRQNGAGADTDSPLRIAFNKPPALPLAKVVSGAGSTYVIDAAGRVFSFGNNNKGQLGHGDTVNRAIATRIEALVSAGVIVADVVPSADTGGTQNYVFFRTTAGKVYACGDNANGQLGVNDTTDRTSPVHVTQIDSAFIVGVAVSGNVNPHSLAWSSGGTMFTAGFNAVGQQGDGTTTQHNIFILSSLSGVAEAVAHASSTTVAYSVCRLTTGALSVTGSNDKGQHGRGDTTNRSAFASVALAASCARVVLRYQTVAALLVDGRVQIWGGNACGQTGNGGSADVLSPQLPAGTFQTSVADVQLAGNDAAMAIWLRTSDGSVWGAGSGTGGGVGTGSEAAVNSTFAELAGISGVVIDMQAVGTPTDFGLSVLYDDGRAGGCGKNANGELGHGTLGATAFGLTDVHLLNRAGPKGDITPQAAAAATAAADAALDAIAARDEVLAAQTEFDARLDVVELGRYDMPPGLGLETGEISGATGAIVGGTAADGNGLVPFGLDTIYDGFGYMTDADGVRQIARIDVDGMRQMTRGPGDKTIEPYTDPDAIAYRRENPLPGTPLRGIVRRNVGTVLATTDFAHVYIVPTYGQSTNLGQTGLTLGGSSPFVINATPPEPELLWTFDTHINPRSNAPFTNVLQNLVPAHEALYGEACGESPSTAFGLGVLEAHDRAHPVIVFGGGLGGSALSLRLPGTQPYANLVAMIQRATDLAQGKWPGCTVSVPVINLQDGESDFNGDAGTYQTQLGTLFNQLDIDIASITGQASPCRKIVGQTLRISGDAPTLRMLRGSNVGVFNYALANPDTLWRQPPFMLRHDDYIGHFPSPEYLRVGSLAVQAYDEWVRAGRRLLLYMVGGVRTGNIVDVTFNDLPTTLEIDPNIKGLGLTLGFAYTDNSSFDLADDSTFVREARLTGPRTARIWLDNAPTGAAKKIAISWADPTALLQPASHRYGPRTPLFTRHHYCCPWTGEPMMIRPAGHAISIV